MQQNFILQFNLLFLVKHLKIVASAPYIVGLDVQGLVHLYQIQYCTESGNLPGWSAKDQGPIS